MIEIAGGFRCIARIRCEPQFKISRQGTVDVDKLWFA